ncbi:hypothetical protein [Streptomyces thermolineatus]|uniref:hypothetical protein n=1 Tax=Streptomyces thermolineatus TaxID=44033 RepID=UPI00384D8DD4
MAAPTPTLPPVRLLPAARLAAAARETPLLDAAVRLARWTRTEGGRAVDDRGGLAPGERRAAAAELGPASGGTPASGPVSDAAGGTEEDGRGAPGALAAAGELDEAWDLAGYLGLVDVGPGIEVVEDRPDDGRAGRPGDGGTRPAGGTVRRGGGGRAVPGPALEQAEAGSPDEVLSLWQDAVGYVVARTVGPDPQSSAAPSGSAVGGAAGHDPASAQAFLDAALENLYVISALEPSGGRREAGAAPTGPRPPGAPAPAGTADGPAATGPAADGVTAAVPLPVLAASLVVPDGTDEPTPEVLEELTSVMARLDDLFAPLAAVGLVDHSPAGPRHGSVRLTPLGVYAVRRRLLDAGYDAPALGDAAERDAAALLTVLARYPEEAARTETARWLARRSPAGAAEQLLDAARGDDPQAPLRRLSCQQVLAMLGPVAEPAVRAVLDDPHLGGLARVWLAEHGAAGVPGPTEETVLWLTVDTVAAQLGAEDEHMLRELVRDLVVRHESFFNAAWRVDHPATAEVLEAMGRLHPDRDVAKEARRAAFRARSRHRAH